MPGPRVLVVTVKYAVWSCCVAAVYTQFCVSSLALGIPKEMCSRSLFAVCPCPSALLCARNYIVGG